MLALLNLAACIEKTPITKTTKPQEISKTSLILLGTLQDAGAPHIGCKKKCCSDLFKTPDPLKQVISLGLYDADTRKKYLFEATPDFPKQMDALKKFGSFSEKKVPDGIFLTHAHIGHYTGLMYLGKEALDSKSTSVFTLPKMTNYLTNNGPWSQLVTRKNIVLLEIDPLKSVSLSSSLEVIPFLVPHRDEYSETAGYRIIGPNKQAIFIPDIDKWGKWETNIIEEIASVDYAFLDATFFSGDEINSRDISEIPHPFIIESMDLFKNMSEANKNKVIFIHFNHTNPAIDLHSEAAKKIRDAGFNIGSIYDTFEL